MLRLRKRTRVSSESGISISPSHLASFRSFSVQVRLLHLFRLNSELIEPCTVGSGKTTLLLSLLGETNVLSGSAYLPSPVVRATGEDPSFLTETTSYCSQAPFLQSATIKDNILFGAVLNQKRYEEVLRCCSLGVDLDSLALGDETEVGEKGTVLSGGQSAFLPPHVSLCSTKTDPDPIRRAEARISLARAIYSSAKYVLLDDVLSAVDSHTAQHLVANCLRGEIMRHRTCVLVTHAVDLCLPVASFVVTMYVLSSP